MGKKNNSEYKVKMRYAVSTPKPVSIVVTVVCKGEPGEAMREVNNFVKLLDKEIMGFLERRSRTPPGRARRKASA